MGRIKKSHYQYKYFPNETECGLEIFDGVRVVSELKDVTCENCLRVIISRKKKKQRTSRKIFLYYKTKFFGNVWKEIGMKMIKEKKFLTRLKKYGRMPIVFGWMPTQNGR